MKPALLLAALLLLVATPSQAQQAGIDNPFVSTPTSLYFHVIDFGDMPINTQLPDPEFTADQGYAAGTATLKCLHPTTGDVTKGMTSQELHTAYAYSSPSYVEYDYLSAGNRPRIHAERGISYDAILDQDYPFVVEWYVAVYNGGDATADSIPTPTPGVVIAATMRAGETISVDDRGYDSGPTIALGRTAPATLVPSPVPGQGGAFDGSGQPHPQVDWLGVVDGKYLYRFRVPMDYESDRILRATGFNVRLDMFVDNPHCTHPTEAGKEYIMPSTLAGYTSAQYRPRLDLAVMNPIRVEYIHPQMVGDELVVHTALNSVWGNYDVQERTEDGIRVAITGPTAAASLEKVAFVQRSHEHYHHQEAVDVTYVWDFKADRAVDGVYKVDVSFQNDQGTATASGTALFEIGKGELVEIESCGEVQEATQTFTEDCTPRPVGPVTNESANAPGLPLALGLLALGGVAALRRR